MTINSRSAKLLMLAFGAGLLVCLLVAFAQVRRNAPVTRPRRVGESSNSSASGRETFVKTGGNLQRALDAARPGETIALEAGAVFNGTFTLPKKDGDDFITIRSARADELPADARVSPNVAAL